MYHREQTQLGNRGLNPVAINQFFFYFALFSHLEIFFTLRSLLHFLKNFTFKASSFVFVPLFFTENEAEIIQL